MDFCAQGLRNIIMGLGGKNGWFHDGLQVRHYGEFELMAILSIVRDLKDLRERLGKIIVAYDKKGNPVTTHRS